MQRLWTQTYLQADIGQFEHVRLIAYEGEVVKLAEQLLLCHIGSLLHSFCVTRLCVSWLCVSWRRVSRPCVPWLCRPLSCVPRPCVPRLCVPRSRLMPHLLFAAGA